MNHIGIDGNLLCGNRTGMGHVLYSLLENIPENNKNLITIFVPESLELKFCENIKKKNIKIVIIRKTNYFFWEQFLLPYYSKKYKVDTLWSPYNTAPILGKFKKIVTVHDVIYLESSIKSASTLYKKMGIIYRKIVVPQAIKNSTKIITVSKDSQNRILKFFPSVKNKIDVIYNGTDLNIKFLSSSEYETFYRSNNIKKPYILAFGSLEKRKNTLGVIKAYEVLPEEIKNKYQLVLFGFRGFEGSFEKKYIRKKNLEKNIIVMGYISDEEKNTLLSAAELFVFPSYSEGFGLPILEAFLNDVPVITSKVTSLPEVGGEAVIYVDPTNTNEISEAIIFTLTNDKEVEKLIARGKEQLKMFSWETSAKQLQKIFIDADRMY